MEKQLWVHTVSPNSFTATKQLRKKSELPQEEQPGWLWPPIRAEWRTPVPGVKRHTAGPQHGRQKLQK